MAGADSTSNLLQEKKYEMSHSQWCWWENQKNKTTPHIEIDKKKSSPEVTDTNTDKQT